MSENRKSWLWRRWRTMLLLVIAGVVGWSAYSYWLEYSEEAAKRARESMSPSVGSQCSIIFRREEIGLDQALLNRGSINGTENSVRGTFVKLNDEWIVLRENDREELWIPCERVLLMRVER